MNFKAQDIEAGDGTTTVVVICGALLDAAKELLSQVKSNFFLNILKFKKK